jgi:hypothetical protein
MFYSNYFYCKVESKTYHECLWNIMKPSYRNNQMRMKALENMVEEMGIQLTTYLSHISPNYYYRIKHVEFDVFEKLINFAFLCTNL